MNKELKDYTDIELANAQGAQNQEMRRVQNNLLMINAEIENRVPKVEPKKE